MLLFVALAHAVAPPTSASGAAAAAQLPVDDAAIHAQLLDEVDHPGMKLCLTEVVEQLRLHWDHLSVADRAHVSAVLAPDGKDMFAPAPAAAAPPPAKDSCWSEYDNRLVGEHFVVEWEEGVDADDAQQFLDDLETSWSVEVDGLGWAPFDGSDSYLMLVEIQNKRTGGAYTTVKSCGGQYIPYIVSGKDSWDDPDWGASMAPHEFNHALQFGYSYAPEFWWWEATATYMEDNVFPDINYWGDYVAGYTQNPHIALSASSQQDQDIFWHMYGLAIFGFYLDNYQGGPDTVLATWEDARKDHGQYNKSAHEMVDDLNVDWDTVYADWIARNTVMDYDQQRYFPEIAIHDQVRALPNDGSSDRSDEPEGYGQNYIFINGGLGTGDLVVHFTGNDKVEWSVQLVEVENSRVSRVAAMVGTNGAGDITLTGYGDNDVYLVVSPLTADDSGYDYEWSAELISVDPPDTGSGDTANPGDPAGDGNGDGSGNDGLDLSTGAGCGCTTGGSDGAAVAGGLLAMGAIARRRKR